MPNTDVRNAIDAGSIAHLATVAEDGAPHAVPVFVATRGEQILFFTGPQTRKARNLRHEPRVALSILTADNPYNPIVVRGRVVEWIDGTPAGRSSTRSRSSTPAPRTRAARSASSPSSSPSGTVGVG